jgi:hypothetical protein
LHWPLSYHGFFCLGDVLGYFFAGAQFGTRHHGTFSGILCAGIAGGAVVPLIVGGLGEFVGLQLAMLFLFVPLGYILSIGLWAKPLVNNETVTSLKDIFNQSSYSKGRYRPLKAESPKVMYKIILLLDFAEEYSKSLMKGINAYSREFGPWIFCRMPLFHRETVGIDGILKWALEWGADGIVGQLYNKEIEKIVRAENPCHRAGF